MAHTFLSQGLRRVPLTVKAVALTAVVAALVWHLLDPIHSSSINALFNNLLMNDLRRGASHDRIQLDHMLSRFHGTAELIITNHNFSKHLPEIIASWTEEQTQPNKLTAKPRWMPSNTILRHFTIPRYIALYDTTFKLREYVLEQSTDQLPDFLFDPNPILIFQSREQTFMTSQNESPYLITTEQLLINGRAVGYLMLVTPMDNSFLTGLQAQRFSSDSVLVLFDGQEDPEVRISSNPSVIANGAHLSVLSERFLVTGREMFDYGASDLELTFASLISKQRMVDHTRTALKKEQKIRFISAFSLLISFFLTVLWLTRRIRRLTIRVARFTNKNLGTTTKISRFGDQLHVLNDQFDHLTERAVTVHEELRRSANELSEKETRLRAIVNHVADAIIIINDKGIVESFNPAAEKLFGYSSSEMLGGSLEHLMPEHHRKAHREGIRAFRSGHPSNVLGDPVEVAGLRKDGSTFPIELVIRPMHLGEQRYFIGMARDITSRKKLAAIAAVQASSRLFRHTLENIKLAALVINQSGKITFCNEYLANLSGWSRSEITNSNFFELFIPQQSRAEISTLFNDASLNATDSSSYCFELEVTLKDDATRLFFWNATILQDDNNEPLSQAIIGEDITERRKEEQRKRESAQQLQRAKIEAEQASASKTRFLANLSHEIRTPLNAIVGFTQILINNRSQIPDKFNHFLDHIQTGSRNLSELIDNILDLSKIEAGKMTVNPEDINLKLLFQSIFHLNKARALQKSLLYTYDLDPTLPDFIHTDRTLLNQILMNLTSNAIKFTPNGKSVKLEAIRHNDRLLFKVQDEGIGIAEDKKDTIFNPFQQADVSIKGRFGGTGLGLSLVKSGIDLLGGTLTFDSIPDYGTTFTVDLPLIKAVTIEKRKQNNDFTPPSFDPESTILIIEDDPMSRDMIQSLLSDLNLQTLLADNGKSGVELAQTNKPDLILMDMELPVMSGVEAIRTLRKEATDENLVPIIALSANAFEDQQRSALEAGADHFLTKPMDFKTFLPLLKHYLDPIELDKNDVSLQQADTPLPENLEQEMLQNLTRMAEIPLYQAEKIVKISRQCREVCENYTTPLTGIFIAIEEAIFTRNSKVIPEIIQGALHGDNSGS
ncbi:MAG: PAS domain S-box protein [Magnetococcales bacterium]|nr:PAS domain S-box protein [Magnetococcales bacterium]